MDKHFSNPLPPNIQAAVVTSGNHDTWQAPFAHTFDKTGHGLFAGKHFSLHSYIINHQAKVMPVYWLYDWYLGYRLICFGDSDK